jgi:hypothetical protein
MKTLAAMVLVVSSYVLAQVPTITSFSPVSGPVGSVITIAGTNFSPTTTNNIVHSGGVAAYVYTASSTSLEVLVPGGTGMAPITVTTGGLTAYSSAKFSVTFEGTRVITASSFEPNFQIPTSTMPSDVVCADFDGDGKLDIAICHEDSSLVYVYLNTSTPGTTMTPPDFVLQAKLVLPNKARKLAVGDLDGDGKLDLVIATDTIFRCVLQNTSALGTISFGPRIDLKTVGYGGVGTVVQDIDMDGKPDIITVGWSQIYVLRNISTPGTLSGSSFASPTTISTITGGSLLAIDAVDLDGDGKPDLVAVNRTDATLNVFRNLTTAPGISAGSFATPVKFPLGYAPLYCVSIADFDGDGKLDVAVPFQGPNPGAAGNPSGISILHNNSPGIGSISFDGKVDFIGSANTSMTAVADFDGDGKPDIVATGPLILKNQATAGSIAANSFVSVPLNGTMPYNNFGTVADLDGDGRPDLVMLNWDGVTKMSGLNILQNTMQAASISVNTPLQNMATNYAATIMWTSQFVTGTVDIFISTDNGNNYNTTVVFGAANTGTYTWNVPPDQATSSTCKIQVLSSANWATSGVSGPFSIVSNSSVTATQNATVNVLYSSNPTSSQEYRLVSFPGLTDNSTVGQLNLSGTVDQDWSMYREPGSGTGFTELSSGSNLKTGEGYWLIKKDPFSQSVSYPTPALHSDGTFSISLSGGTYSIIGNPFNVSVPWSTVLALNPSLPPSTPLWSYGSNGWSTTGNSDLQPGVGYYINSSGVTSLRIPYPFGGGFPSRAPGFQLQADWRLQLQFASETNKDLENFVGVVPGIQNGKAGPEFQKPPAVFNQSFISLLPPNSDVAHNRYCADYRTNLGEGQIWHFDVVNPGKSQGTLSVVGVDKVPFACGVLLVNEQTGATVNLREHNSMPYGYGKEMGHFKVIVGNSDFITAQVQQYIPKAYALDQNYPNPFNPSTTITFELPKASPVKIEIFSILGQRLKVLAEGVYEAGVHQVVWSGDTENGVKVSSGVYFCRLSAGKELVSVRKMILAK